MEPTQENFNALLHHLAESINALPERRNKGEAFLKTVSTQPGFLLLLLRLQEVKTVDPSLRLGAALHFKNFVRANWGQRDDFVPISDTERAQIKSVLVDLMLSVESNISKTLAEALSIISETEFPHDWPTLLPQLVSKFGSQDWSIINGALATIHSIVRRYRHQFSSDTIKGELKYSVFPQLLKPYHDLFLITTQAITANTNNQEALKTLFVTANLLCKIFYSLNAVELPEFFEDNMASFMDIFHNFLHFQTTFPALLEGQKEESPGLLQKIQANVCANLNLYIEKYEEEVQPFLDRLIQDVWTLLSKTDNSPKVDRLVSATIRFLTTVAKSVYHTLFSGDTTLKEICASVVIPNMKLRESDIEIFEDNPAEYIRRDSEGSDTDTRRRAALELVKGLRKHYEARVTTMVATDITQMLSSGDWISKDTAIYLVTALAVKSSTSAAGTTAVNEMVPIPDFCRTHILPELQGTTRSAVLRATSIKFITTFRQQLAADVYTAALPHVIALMRDPNYVLRSYSATCVERILTVKDNQVLRIGQINDFIGPMLANLFEALNYKDSQENEYTMRAITRVISVAGSSITPFAPTCLQKLVEILVRVAQNSTNPTFAHYVFESLGSLVKNLCAQNPSAVTQFEGVLFPVFQSILEKDINELMDLAKTKRLSELSELEGAQPTPYILQILSLLLELSSVPISNNYAQLFPPLLLVVMWERKSNVPALIRIVQAYLRKGPSIVVAGKHLPAILGIFQNKFNKSKVHDHEGFYLLEAIVENLSLTDIDPYLPAIFQEIFGRLGNEKTKTLKYVKSFLVFLSLFIGKHGPSAVISRIDAIQPNIFAMVLNSLYIPNIGKVNGKIERKMCCVAMIKLLTGSPELLSTYVQLWPKVAVALLGVIELPEDDTVQRGEFAEEDEEIEHFSSATFSPLSFAAKSDVDPFPGVNPKIYLATQLNQLIQSQPQAAQLLAGLEPNAREAIKQYYQFAGLQPPVV